MEGSHGGRRAFAGYRRSGYNPIESLDGRFLYFAKGRPEAGLWRMPVEGGEETAVLPDLPNAGANAPWDVAANGFYFVEFEAGRRWATNGFSNCCGLTRAR